MDFLLLRNITSGPVNATSTTTNPTPVQQLPASTFPEHQLNVSGLFFLVIPTITILGNFLVIIAVLRFKSLQSAINFLILGLAVADLLVGLFVMPYAVYVHVQGGYWFLGSLMCDIYSASDVACSTASILLLTVISFDRYRAVTHPISYSHKSHDTKRVIYIMIVIWVISLALASPIVLGVNIRPPDADPYECRFYNPIFSISSSIISFVIPCFIVLFVYIRIMIALRQRQKIAKARRRTSSSAHSQPLKRISLAKEVTNASSEDSGGQKGIAGIVETVDTTAPSTSDSNPEKLDSGKEKEKELKKSSGTISRLIRMSPGITLKYLVEMKSSKIGVQRRPYDGYGVYVNKNANDEADTSRIDDIEISEIEQLSTEGKNSPSEEFVATQLLERLNCNSSPCPCKQAILNRILQNGFKGRESSTLFVPQPEVYKICELQEGIIIGNKQNGGVLSEEELRTDKAVMDFNGTVVLQDKIKEADVREPHLFTNINAVVYAKPAAVPLLEQEHLKVGNEITDWNGPDNIAVSGKNDIEVAGGMELEGGRHRDYQAAEELQNPKEREMQRVSVNMERKESKKKTGSFSSFRPKSSVRKLLSISLRDSIRNGTAAERTMQMFKRTWNRRESVTARRRATKNQRMEKRATKTLGIVVGIFLACWVPFFSVYILSAMCIKLEIESCQIGFYAFFYTTWLGYINSCVNPIIYTIFNIEFRRAFKCLLFGKAR